MDTINKMEDVSNVIKYRFLTDHCDHCFAGNSDKCDNKYVWCIYKTLFSAGNRR